MKQPTTILLAAVFTASAATPGPDFSREVRPLLDECWWAAVPDPVRLERLTDRHVAYGKEAAAARAWAEGPDEANARLVAPGRVLADLVVRVP